MEVISGVHLLKLPLPIAHIPGVNCYLILDGDDAVLIDAGWDSEDCFQSLKAQVAACGLELAKIGRVVITHTHPDHFGLAARLKREHALRFAYHSWEEALVRERYGNYATQAQAMDHYWLQHGLPNDTAPIPARSSLADVAGSGIALPDEALFGDEEIACGERLLQVIWTPGHSPGHICLYDPERRVLFSGDHVLRVFNPTVNAHPMSGNDPLGFYLHSLERLAKLPASLVLPAHGEPFADLTTRLIELRRHYERRLGSTLSIVRESPGSAFVVAEQLIWEYPGTQFARLDPMYQRMALMETVSYLECLRTRGDVERRRVDGGFFYTSL